MFDSCLNVVHLSIKQLNLIVGIEIILLLFFMLIISFYTFILRESSTYFIIDSPSIKIILRLWDSYSLILSDKTLWWNWILIWTHFLKRCTLSTIRNSKNLKGVISIIDSLEFFRWWNGKWKREFITLVFFWQAKFRCEKIDVRKICTWTYENPN